jgi:hypothetical protein
MNKPLVLTCLGAAGTVGTAILAAWGAPRAKARKIAATVKKGDELTKKESVVAQAPAYLPAIGAGLATLLCIFGANALNTKQQASLASAYAMLEQTFRAYRKSTMNLYGEEADEEIRKGFLSMCADEVGPSDEEVIFYEEHYAKFFERTKEEVLSAEYHFNRNFVLRGYANLNEFYDFLGLDHTEYGEKHGWSVGAGEAAYGYSWVDFEHKKLDMDDFECWIIHFPFAPTKDYLDADF